MSDKFKAIVLNQSEKNFSREVKILEKNFFKAGDVLVKIDYSGLNYKDALILKNGATLVKEYPHIPGIDFSGKVLESKNDARFAESIPFPIFFKGCILAINSSLLEFFNKKKTFFLR